MAYSDRFNEALVFAARIHKDQVRKGADVPYITHLLAVASIVGEAGGTEDQVIAGLLHDAIEDCIAALPDIREQLANRFGEAVLTLVEGCTDSDTLPKPPWRARKEAYLDHLRGLPPNADVLLVSLSDKIHNAGSILRDYRQIGEPLWERFNGKREGTLWYYTELAHTFATQSPGPLADELTSIVRTLIELAHDRSLIG
jgi:(p)ppGpp synthase/HD superfamily hydrolase